MTGAAPRNLSLNLTEQDGPAHPVPGALRLRVTGLPRNRLSRTVRGKPPMPRHASPDSSRTAVSRSTGASSSSHDAGAHLRQADEPDREQVRLVRGQPGVLGDHLA